jgi:starch synthase
MRIAIVSPEAVPFAKTGGLADVAGALPKELAGLGHEVRLVMPKYKAVDETKFGLKDTGKEVLVPLADKVVRGRIFTAAHDGYEAVFIANDDFYMRDNLYGDKSGDFSDNASRFVFFAKAVPVALVEIGFGVDIMHVNDWQSALIPLFFRSIYKNDAYWKKTATLLTIHNLGYQGIFWHLDMPLLGVGWDYFTPSGIEFWGKINFLKAGILYADLINTVSETYAREITTPEFGFGLDGVLRDRKDDLFGVVNGVDTDVWDPRTDALITARYDAETPAGKVENKKALLGEFYLPERLDLPLVGVISRLADQKGFDILAEAFDEIMAMDLMMVVLGTGDARYHELFTRLGKQYPTKLGVKLAFNVRLSHLIEAGSDIFLMPSRYEPCGLNQMMSMRYGTVPVVRATGGLADTVIDYNEKTHQGTGVRFLEYDAASLVAALKRAVSLFAKKKQWEVLMKNGMAADFSWRASAVKYERLYGTAISRKLSPAGGGRPATRA